MNLWRSFVLGALLLIGAPIALAQGTTMSSSAACQDSGFLSKARAITDLCYTCFFPMKIAGLPIGFGTRGPSRLPSRTAFPFCICPGRTGYPSPGFAWGYWRPTHAIELTRRPFCSPILFGLQLGGSGMESAMGFALAAQDGGPGTIGNGVNGGAGGFYNFHWMKFPLEELLGLLDNVACGQRGDIDMDYGYLTELDPTWQSEMLALYTHPEIKLFTAIAARAVCIADAVAATAVKPIETAFYCAGAWGLSYPFAGKVPANNTIESQMLSATRGLAAMHRRTLAKLSYSTKAICRDRMYFVLPKQQYQFQNFWPFPQRNQAQWIGTASMKFGQWRKLPVRGEDRVLMQWSYKECCVTAW